MGESERVFGRPGETRVFGGPVETVGLVCLEGFLSPFAPSAALGLFLSFSGVRSG